MVLLFDREDATRQVDDWMGRVLRGRGTAVTIEGEAGVGKSTILDLIEERARDSGANVLRAHGAQWESSLEFGLARRLFAGVDGAVLADAPAAGRDALSASDSSTSPDDLLTACYGLFWICSELAESAPLVILVDDAHWSDDATIRFLSYVLERIGPTAIGIAVATRPVVSGSSEDPTKLSGVLADPRVRHVKLRALSAAATSELVRSSRPDLDEDICTAVHEVTGGNPFYVGCLVDELSGQESVTRASVSAMVPEAVTRSVLARLAALDSADRGVAVAVAILGEDARIRHVATHAGIPGLEAMECVDRLVGSGVLSTAEPIGFRHPIMRNAIISDLPPGRIARERRRAAELLIAAGESPVRSAFQLLHTEPIGDPWVVEQLSAGAKSAYGPGHHQVRTTLLSRALAEPPSIEQRPATLTRLGIAERRVAAPAAVEHLRLALDGCGPGQAGRLVFELAGALEADAQVEESLSLIRTAREPGELRENLTDLEADLLDSFDSVLRNVALLPANDAGITRMRTRLEDSAVDPAEVRVYSGVLAVNDALRGGSATEVLAHARTCIGDRFEAHDLALTLTFGLLPAIVAAGEPRWAMTAIDPIEAAKSAGAAVAAAGVTTWRGYAHLATGALVDAEAELGTAVQQLAESASVGLSAAVGLLAEVQLETQGPGVASQTLSDHALALDGNRVAQWGFYLRAAAAVALAEQDYEVAAEHARSLGDLLTEAGMVAPSLYPWRLLLAVAELGLGNKPTDLIAEQLELARAFGETTAIAEALLVQSRLLEEPAARRAVLEEALPLAAPGPLVAMRVLDTLAEDASATDPAAAARHWGTAYELATVHGALWRRRAIADGLARVGAGAPKVAPRAGSQLTPSELRVCRLAASGAITNREIAQSLFVTAKTVETHLSSAYRKLAVSSRAELAGVLGPAPDEESGGVG